MPRFLLAFALMAGAFLLAPKPTSALPLALGDHAAVSREVVGSAIEQVSRRSANARRYNHNRYAVGPTSGMASRILRGLSRWRIDNDVYAAPFEKAVVTRLRHEQSLS